MSARRLPPPDPAQPALPAGARGCRGSTGDPVPRRAHGSSARVGTSQLLLGFGLAPDLLQACEIIQRLSRLKMLRSVLLLADVQRPHVEWLGLCILSLFSIEV